MYLDILVNSLEEKFGSEVREGVHVSDLCLCPRKSIFNRLEPQKLTPRDLNFFTSGRAIHDSIQILAKRNPDKFDIERETWLFDDKQTPDCGIVAHIDLYDKEKNVPIECKSHRTAKIDKPKKHHVDQVQSYMAMVNSKKGIILYQLLMHFEDKPFVEFEIEMKDKELEKKRKDLIDKAKRYAENLKNKTPLLMEGALGNPDLEWLCLTRDGKPNCPFYEICKEAQKK